MPEEKTTPNLTTPGTESSEDQVSRVVIPAADWHTAIAGAIKGAEEPTALVVDTEAKKELALIAAERMGKSDKITVEIAEAEEDK